MPAKARYILAKTGKVVHGSTRFLVELRRELRGLFEMMLVDAERADLRIERRRR